MRTGLLYSAGDCPICFSSGLVAVLVDRRTSSGVFYCPMCGCAWRRVPDARQPDDPISDLASIAPDGVRLPTEAEVLALRADGLEAVDADFDFWASDLDDVHALDE
jgi:hypothetical protein